MVNTSNTIERARPRANTAQALTDRIVLLMTNDIAVAASLVLLVLLFNVPYFNVPYFWDTWQITAGTDFILGNNFRPLLPAWDPVNHPVLLHEILAFSWLVLGKQLWVSHFVMAVFAFFGTFFTYKVGKLLYGAQAGVIAAALLLFFPLFRAQSTVILFDLPAGTFAIMAVYFMLKGKAPLYVLAASALVMTKETGVLIIPAILLYLFVTNLGKKNWRQMVGMLAVYTLPVVVQAGWFVYHALETGWWTPREDQLIIVGIPSFLAALPRLIWQYLIRLDYIGVITLIILVFGLSYKPVVENLRGKVSIQSIVHAVKQPPFWHVWGPAPVLLLLGLPILIHTAFSAFMGQPNHQMHRYLLVEYPLFFIMAAKAIQGVFKRQVLITSATCALLLMFVAGWVHPLAGYSRAEPSGLQYTDFVEIHQQAASYIENHYAGKTVLAGWPQYIEIAQPLQGYVKQPVTIYAYAEPKTPTGDRIKALGGQYFNDPTTINYDAFDLIYYAPDTGSARDAKVLPDIIKRLNAPLLVEFKKGGEYVAIYGNPNKGFVPSSGENK